MLPERDGVILIPFGCAQVNSAKDLGSLSNFEIQRSSASLSMTCGNHSILRTDLRSMLFPQGEHYFRRCDCLADVRWVSAQWINRPATVVGNRWRPTSRGSGQREGR